MGRSYLGYGEITRMIVAENIKIAYQDRASSGASEWAGNNPGLNKALSNAFKLAKEMGWE